MSTILDALKKSERERKRSNMPTLADMPTPEEPSRWPVYIGLLVIVLLLAAITWVVSQRSTDSPSGKLAQIVVSNDTVESTEQIQQDDEIIVNVLSYSEQPEQRFVMVNGKMYRQGEFVRAGLKVVEIEPESVIFNLRGRRVVRKP